MTAELVCGGMAAAYFLVGRWHMGRVLAKYYDTEAWRGAFEPRHWIFVLFCVFVPLILTAQWPRAARRPALASEWLLFGFLFYMVFTVTWTRDWELGLAKALEVGQLAIFCLIFRAALRGLDAARLVRQFFFWLTAGLLALGTIGVAAAGSGRLAVLGGGPNVFGRNMGLLMLLAIHYARKRRSALVFPSIAALALLMVFFSGSRGALFGTAAGAVTVLMYLRIRLGGKVALVAAVLVVAAVIASSTAFGARSVTMLERRVLDADLLAAYDRGRKGLFVGAWEMGLDSPLGGAGLASFRKAHTGYPHNIFLEAFAEGGGLGLALLSLGLLLFAAEVVRSQARYDATAVASFALALASAQVSGDFYDSRGVFIFAIVVLASRRSGVGNAVGSAAAQGAAWAPRFTGLAAGQPPSSHRSPARG